MLRKADKAEQPSEIWEYGGATRMARKWHAVRAANEDSHCSVVTAKDVARRQLEAGANLRTMMIAMGDCSSRQQRRIIAREEVEGSRI